MIIQIRQILDAGRRIVFLTLASMLTACGGAGGTTFVIEPNSCTSLLQATIEDVTLDKVQVERAADGYGEHCLVRGHTLSGRVGFELRSPLRGGGKWNGRLLAQGTGGYSGTIDPALGLYRTPTDIGLLASNYAVVTTDTGHVGAQNFETYFLPQLDASWALDKPTAEQDFAWRGSRAATVAAQRLLRLIHQRDKVRTYFVGCSGAGRMGMKLAETSDDVFDGFVIGDPPLAFSREMARAHWNTVTASALPLPPAKLRFFSQSVLDRCDALDGAADGLVSDPERCKVNPFEFVCSSGNAANCLTSNEAVAIFRYYQGPVNNQGQQVAFGLPQTGAEDCNGLCSGDEDGVVRFREGWGWWFAGGPISTADGVGPISLTPDRAFGNVIAMQFFRYLATVPDQPLLKWSDFDPVNNPIWLERGGALLDVKRVDFSAFRANGKRILIYQGWADATASPLALLDYRRRVQAASGGAAATDEFLRVFMVPGMQHCENGRALDDFDAVNPLVDWVEKGTPPETLRARNRWSSAFPGRERDICAYPKISTYKGSGSFDQPASFECRLPAAAP